MSWNFGFHREEKAAMTQLSGKVGGKPSQNLNF